jgi:hypothetical protein
MMTEETPDVGYTIVSREANEQTRWEHCLEDTWSGGPSEGQWAPVRHHATCVQLEITISFSAEGELLVL